MAHYVDGYVVPVPKAKLAEYRKLANTFGKIWIEHGALGVFENVADDVKLGKRTSFPQAVKLKEDEVVVFSWITFESRRARDKVNKAVMADPRVMAMDHKNVPFDGKRMFWGGFKSLIALQAKAT